MNKDILFEGLRPEDLKPEAKQDFDINAEAQQLVMNSPRPVSLEESHLKDVLVDTHIYSPPDILAQGKLRDHFSEAFEILTERERDVLKQRFGLDDGREKTLMEIGVDLGMRERGKPLTKERIRQIEYTALKKLRQPENRQHMQDYLE